jgi:hypothetical protein
MKTLCIILALAAGGTAVEAAGASRGAVAVDLNADPTPAELAAIKRTHMTDGTLEQDTLLPVTVGHADLNGDHRPDLIYRSDNHAGCGSLGCATYALLAAPVGYARTSIDLAVSGGKVFVLPTMRKGMHDLRFQAATYIFKWNGTEYQ